MGMYDCVIYECLCPRCGAKLDTFQSKDGPCTQETLTPNDVNNMYDICNACGEWVEFDKHAYSNSIPTWEQQEK